MIKRILVALDPDEDTKTATLYAIHLAKHFDASLTGMAVVDIGNLHANIGAGGYGGELYALEIREDHVRETDQVADRLLNEFRETAMNEGVKFLDVKRRGASGEQITEEMKVHDLLVVGRDSRFFYNEPDRDTKTLAYVVKKGSSPTLVVTRRYHDIRRVMIAWDGSAPAARSLKDFVHLLPYGKGVEIDLVTVVEERTSAGRRAEVIERLHQAAFYLDAHEFSQVTTTVLEGGKPWKELLNRQSERKPDLVVLGAHSVSAIRRATFGSTTHKMIAETAGPLFLSP